MHSVAHVAAHGSHAPAPSRAGAGFWSAMMAPRAALLLALVGVGAMTRAEAKAERQLRKAKKLQKKARARDSLVRDSAHLGKII